MRKAFNRTSMGTRRNCITLADRRRFARTGEGYVLSASNEKEQYRYSGVTWRLHNPIWGGHTATIPEEGQ